ncbi:MAG TPA: N-acetyl-gamma-glutamyl-phosphate reductase [Acidobacteriota bacterium]|nr:N-acetyl-gamma-glutamyl-phosphate reductase [Acidobacteriota bacterium]
MVKCAVIGGSGYIGGELIRLLAGHPHTQLVAVTGRETVGKQLGDVHPHLASLNLTINPLAEVEDAEVVFLALPNGEAMKQWSEGIAEIAKTHTVIDTSADFRLQDRETFEQFYRTEHPCFGSVKQFVYGQPELFVEQIREARLVASPGCFATAVILALYPLAAAGLIDHAVVNAVTGSSGSGIKVKEKTHHPFRMDSFYAYEPFVHRHIPEIKQAIFFRTGHNVDFVFQPHSGPFVRGIFVTAVVTMPKDYTTAELQNLYRELYESKPFVRFTDHSPNVKFVRGTNFCDLSIKSNGHHVIVMAAIDNLVKGGAGQAVQSFNLMKGFDETTGLMALPTIP